MPELNGPTLKQLAVVPLVAAGMLSKSAIARELGIARETVDKALQDPTVQSQIETLKRRNKQGQLDNARALAKKSLGLAHKAVDSESGDPIEQVQLAAGGITVAAKYSESFGEDSVVVPGSEARAEYRRFQRQKQFLAVLVCQRWPGAVEAYRKRAKA